MLTDFFSLLYPNLCAGCGRNLVKSEIAICTKCKYDFDYTKFQSLKDNDVTRIFMGRIIIRDGFSLMAFHKSSVVQNVLHEIKYKSNKEAGIELGRMIGTKLSAYSPQYDVIIPVPLHPKKLKQRGYNQAELLAEGISEKLSVPVDTSAFIRTNFTETQTKKGREDRWDNVEEVFQLKKPDNLIEQNVLLVDDVITTGATIDACGTVLLRGPLKSLSVASVACVF